MQNIFPRHLNMLWCAFLPLLLLLVTTSNMAGVVTAVPVRNYTNCAFVNVPADLRIHWTINGTNVQVAIEAAVTGYFSIGFSTVADMGSTSKYADAWAVGGKTGVSGDSCANGCIIDYYLAGYNKPIKNSVDTLKNKLVTVSSNRLVGEFTRSLVATSNQDWTISLTAPMFVIWAYHPSNKIKNSGLDCPEHRTNYGGTQVHFGRASSCTASSSNGTSWTSSAGDFRLKWSRGVENSVDYIEFTMDADTTGYLSLGLSTTGSMSQSDMYTGWVVGTTVSLFDVYSPDKNQPLLDTAQGGTSDVRGISGSEANGKTTITFRRNLVTNDPKDQKT